MKDIQFKPVKKSSLSESILEEIKDMIARKELLPGSRLPSEQELAVNFNVGRHTVREALKKLSVMGLVESRVGHGSYITNAKPGAVLNFITSQLVLSFDDVEKLMELRKILEINFVGLAAERASEKDCEELSFFIQNMKQSINDPKKFVEEDVKFHFSIAKASKNEFYGIVLNAVRDMLFALQKEVVRSRGAMDRALKYHNKIYESISNKDIQAAEIFMKEHMEDTYRAIKEKKK